MKRTKVIYEETPLALALSSRETFRDDGKVSYVRCPRCWSPVPWAVEHGSIAAVVKHLLYLKVYWI